MIFTEDKLKEARDAGYSDEEIWSHVSSADENFNTAKSEGYSLDEVATYLSSKKPESPVGDTLQTSAEELEAGIGRAGSAFAKTAVGSVRMFTDLFGANNKVSKEIAGVEDYIDQFTTAQAKQDKEEVSRLFQEAEGKGLGSKVMAGLKAVAVSPETLGPEIAGYMLPSLAAGVLTGGASIPVQIGAQAAIGAAQAAGSIKGDIYQSVRDYSREQGLDEVEADRAATEAQSYGGKNLDLILTNAGIGALAASTGAERIATRILTGRGQAVTKKTLGEFIKQGAAAGGVEALTEGGQEAAEQISQNIALQREGKDVPTFQNVPQVATMGAVAGGVIGGGLKGVEFLSAEERAEQDINRSADREARLLSATDSTTRKVANDLNQSENAIDSLRQELDTLEPTDPRAQQLRMRISEEQKKSAGLKQSIGTELLSEPITEAERQQAELAKAFVEEAAGVPTIKEPLTVPPAQAAPVIEGLQAVSDNTATPEQLTQLSQSGLVDIIKGQPVINEEGQAALTKAQAPLPKLTPEERVAEIEAEPVEQVVTPPVELDTQTRNGIQSGVASADPDMRELWAIQLKAKLDKKGSLTWKDIPQELSDSMDTMEFGALKKALAINPQAAINLIEGNVTPPVKVTPAPVVSEEVAQVSEVTPAPTIAEAAPVEPTTPAPVAKKPAPAAKKPAPAPEVAPVQRDVTKPEQMTPQEFMSDRMTGVDTEATTPRGMDTRSRTFSILRDAFYQDHQASIQKSTKARKPVSASAVDEYGIKLPEGYTKQGELYVYQPAVSETIAEQVPTEVSGKIKRGAKRRRMADRPTPLPENERYGQVKLNRRVQKYFGGKIPDRVYVVDDAVDPEYEYKAAYYPDLGILILNNAFIKKNENVGDIIAHELGHYAFGDKKFKAAFDRFYNSLSPEEKVDVDNLMGDAYKKDTEESQMEEKKVIAFTSYTIATPQRRTLWNAVLDAMKAFANKFLGKNFEFSDPTRTALAMLATAKKRFAAGEEIVREEEEAKRVAAQGMNARFAELEARAKAGDKEAEEEAQRMVDEAAKEAGYNESVFHSSNAKDITVFQRLFPNFVSRDREYTKGYGKYTYNLKLKLEKPFDTTNPEYLEIYNNEFVPYARDAYQDSRYKPIQQGEKVPFTTADALYQWLTTQIIENKIDVDGIIVDERTPNWTTSDTLVPISASQIKSADPFTYDDAGNLIPLSERFQPTTPDIRRMAARSEQIKGEKIGPLKTTPEGIIAKTQELLRKQFDPSKVSENNTTEAFRALGRLTGRGGTDFAKELNDVGRVVDESGAASEISMGAALFINDLFEYSIRLAAEGNKKLLGIMLTNINKLPTAGIGVSDAARDLRARLELAQRFLTMAQAEQDAYTNYVAEFIYGPNPTKEQIQSIKDAYAAVDKTEPITEQELTDEIKAVGDRTETDLVGKINEEFTKATEKGKEKRKTEEEELDTEYKKVQKQADAEIEKLAKIQSDTPSFDPAAARQITNDVRAIVSTDLKQKPDMGRKAPWKSMLVAKLQEAGVELTAAETLADIVWRQHEINSLSRELSSINKAIEKGPISEIVKAIKDTPLEEQQNPNWRYEVMRDYLRRAGLNVAQSERIAKLMDISLQKRFTMAQEEAFTQAISKSAPWKTGDTRSRRAFQKVLQALRAGALDPARNVLSDMAALNGWTGFTPEQYKVLLKNDAILSDPKSADATKAEAHKAIQNIISKAKLPIRARDVIGQFYDAQALSGIPTITVNIFSPAGMAAKNTLTQAMNGVLTARPEQITASLTTLIDSIKSWANTVAFSFKNNVTVYSNVEYLVNDEGLLKLYKRGVDQFKNGKTPRERADGVKNMMIGMMDYVRRVLNALDYGAIASLQNQAVSKYALAAMQAKGMSSKDGAKMLNAMMEQKRNFYNDQIAIGTDKNKAAVLADEFFVSAWRQALTDAKLPAQEVMDAALNDALSAVGRNRQSLDAFREEETNTRDEGVLSFPAIWLLETMANAANKQDNQLIKIFSRIIYGFAVIPARVFRETAWFSPYGAVRFAYDAIAKKMGKTSPYAQSLGNDLQYRQRLTETIAGSIVFLSFLAAMSSSTEDEEDEKPFKIVVTGNGPLRSEDPQYYDSWMKKNKPNTVSLYFGKTKFTINTMRGFEAFAWPAMMLGAVDDWNIRRKQKRETNTPAQMGDAAIVAGNVLSASLRRGPYSFAAKPLFEAYGDRGVESLVKSLAFPAKTLVPVLGASLARNISDFLNDPIDRRTLDGALWSNVPIIGPAVAPKSYNAFGEPTLANEASDKLFKLGIPITFRIPSDRQSVMLHELVLKQGGGPSIPTRNQLAQRIDRQPTNKEYERFVKDYGFEISEVMKENLQELSEMSGKDYDTAMEFIGNNARDVAEFNITNAETP